MNFNRVLANKLRVLVTTPLPPVFLSQLICFPSGRANCMTSVCVCVCARARVCVCVWMHGEWQGNQSCFPDVRAEKGNEENRPDKRERSNTNRLSSA